MTHRIKAKRLSRCCSAAHACLGIDAARCDQNGSAPVPGSRESGGRFACPTVAPKTCRAKQNGKGDAHRREGSTRYD